MQKLEKILEEIDETIARYGKNPYIDEKVTDLCYGLNIAKDIIRNHLSREKAPETTRCSRDNDGWIPVEKEQPEEDGFYIATMDGKIVGQEEPFVGLAEFENGKWIDDEEDYKCVIAWRPLPDPYRPERSE